MISEEVKEGIISKAGFPLYVDYYDKYFSKMNAEQLKETIEIIFFFTKTGEVSKSDDLAIDMVVTTIIDNIVRDEEKRLKQRKASVKNGKKGGRPKKEPTNNTTNNPNKEKNVKNDNNKKSIKKDFSYLYKDVFSEEVCLLFEEFLQHRKSIGVKEETERKINGLINKIKDLTEEQQKQEIERTLINNWKSFYPDNNNNNNNTTSYKRTLSDKQLQLVDDILENASYNVGIKNRQKLIDSLANRKLENWNADNFYYRLKELNSETNTERR